MRGKGLRERAWRAGQWTVLADQRAAVLCWQGASEQTRRCVAARLRARAHAVARSSVLRPWGQSVVCKSEYALASVRALQQRARRSLAAAAAWSGVRQSAASFSVDAASGQRPGKDRVAVRAAPV
jgi:hypothetical protein